MACKGGVDFCAAVSMHGAVVEMDSMGAMHLINRIASTLIFARPNKAIEDSRHRLSAYFCKRLYDINSPI